MESLGDDTYKFYLDNNNEVILTENEINNIVNKYETYIKDTNTYESVNKSELYPFHIKREVIMLTTFEVGLFAREFNKHFDNKLNMSKLIKKRPYNNAHKIKQLFKKYNTTTKNKKEIFSIIANELNITVKAVEKAYYKK